MSVSDYDKRQKERYEDTASFITKSGKLLDIGARTAKLKDYISSDIQYYAIDVNEVDIINLKTQGIQAEVANAEKIPSINNKFDTVVMGEVLEHIPNMGLVLKEVHRVLKNDGHFILSVPNGELKTRLYLTLKRFYKIPFSKKQKNKPVTMGGHIHMFNIRQLSLLMKTYNFVVDEYIGYKASNEYIIMRCHKTNI